MHEAICIKTGKRLARLSAAWTRQPNRGAAAALFAATGLTHFRVHKVA